MSSQMFKFAPQAFSNYNALVLIDTSWWAYKSHYAYKMLSVKYNNTTIPTGVFYGFTRLVQSIHQWNPNAAILFALDKGKSNRDKLLAEYKANRQSSIDFADYISIVASLLAPLPEVYFIALKGYEADDVIASICHLSHSHYPLFIFSNDFDLYQLLSFPNTKIFTTFKRKQPVFYNPSDSTIPIEIIPFWKALKGDKSDNVPRSLKSSNPESLIIQFCQQWRSAFLSCNDLSLSLTQTLQQYPQITLDTKQALLNFSIVDLCYTYNPLSNLICFKSSFNPDLLSFLQLNAYRKYLQQRGLLPSA